MTITKCIVFEYRVFVCLGIMYIFLYVINLSSYPFLKEDIFSSFGNLKRRKNEEESRIEKDEGKLGRKKEELDLFVCPNFGRSKRGRRERRKKIENFTFISI